jgi:hypothetical protein
MACRAAEQYAHRVTDQTASCLSVNLAKRSPSSARACVSRLVAQRCALLFEVDRGIFAVVPLPVWLDCLAPGKSGRGANPWSIAIATGAIANAATATPSSAAERTIEIALMDITGLLELSPRLSCANPNSYAFSFLSRFVRSCRGVRPFHLGLKGPWIYAFADRAKALTGSIQSRRRRLAGGVGDPQHLSTPLSRANH